MGISASRIAVRVCFALLICSGTVGAVAEELPEQRIFNEDWEIKLSTGFDYSSGDYGDPLDTKILFVPVTGKITYGSWSTKLTVPYLRIEGPGTVVGGGDTGPVDTGGLALVETTESGIGDLVASVTYTADLEDLGMYVDLTGKVKIPTADDTRNLGTGETDYTIQLDVTKVIDDFLLFGTYGHKFVGSSARFPLRDINLFSVGAGYQFTPKVGAGVIYDYREAASRTSEDPSEIVGYLTWRMNEHVSTQLYGVAGLSDGSPNASVGLQLSYRWRSQR